MNKHFYCRLACSNIRKNKSMYVPYWMASTLIILLFYGLRSVAHMLLESGAKGSAQMSVILELSSQICGFLSIVILFYINSFIMKRRKKEFGLYSILGMEKRHIAIVMFWEVAISALFCILCGIVFGALFSQLFFLILQGLVGLPVLMVFQIPLNAVAATAALFAIGFFLLLIYDVISIYRSNAIALLRSPKEGEREPKAKWLIALLGVITLGAGYFVSWTVETPSDAVTVFFPAVMLVIVGTFCLFISGSIVILKLLRRNKSFYYRPKNFVAVSGMIYRMKQNATGLSNICILATCLLVTLSSTVCLFLGEEDMLRQSFPREVQTSCIVRSEQSGETLEQATLAHAEKYGVTVEHALGYASFSFPAERVGEELKATKFFGKGSIEVYALLLKDYNRTTGGAYTLAPGELLMASDKGVNWKQELSLQGTQYSIKDTIESPEFLYKIGMAKSVVLVLPSYSDLVHLQGQVNSSLDRTYPFDIGYSFHFDVSDHATTAYFDSMREDLSTSVEDLSLVDSAENSRNAFFQLYGSIFFVGIFFVILFLIAAVLIIYYKQITEGFEDHDRFRIMKNVGMSDKEVRSTISKQVLMVFFLPLGVAVLHIVVAFPVLCKMLVGFGMTNQSLFALCTLGAVLVFAVIYFVVYQLTSKTYYRIVQAKNI